MALLMNNKVLGERLRSLRGKKTQEEIAKVLGLSRARYSHYENDRVEPDSEILNKIADYFDVSIDYLLGRINTPNFLMNKVNVAGKEIELTQEEFEVFNEIRKHPVAFHDLATDPEKKVKQLIKMWEFIKKDLNDDDEGEGFGELED